MRGRKVTALDLNPVAVIKKGNTPAKGAPNTMSTAKVTNETPYQNENSAKKVIKQSTVVDVSRWMVLEPHFVAPVMPTTKAQCLIQFESDDSIASKGFLSSEDIVEALLNRQFILSLPIS